MDGAVPEVDKLIAMGKIFDVSLNDLLQVDGSAPAPALSAGDRRLIRILTALCATLAVVSVLSLCATVYFRHQIMNLLDPPTAPIHPVVTASYDFDPNHENKTFDLALKLDLEKRSLAGYEVTLTAATHVYDDYNRKSFRSLTYPVKVVGDSAYVTVEDMVFRYHKNVSVYLEYTKGEGADALSGSQPILVIEPTGSGLDWNAPTRLVEHPDLPELVHEPNLL